MFDRNMVFSLTYQKRYDFNRNWNFMLPVNTKYRECEYEYDYKQYGRLTALGLSFCFQLTRSISAGFTLNLWKDDITDNYWRQDTKIYGKGKYIDIEEQEKYNVYTTDRQFFYLNGINYHFGILWKVNPKLTIGAVLKTELKTDLYCQNNYQALTVYSDDTIVNQFDISWKSKLNLPLSAGVGIAYKLTDYFTISTDIYKKQWNEAVVIDSTQHQLHPVSGNLENQENIDATIHVRIGAEYTFFDMQKQHLFPVRWGAFYDPAPDENDSDDIYGASIGFGFTKNNWYSIDFACQLRWGNNISRYLISDRNFSLDLMEYKFFLSMIWYKF
jgi:long-subunit fatty acid transport protein